MKNSIEISPRGKYIYNNIFNEGSHSKEMFKLHLQKQVFNNKIKLLKSNKELLEERYLFRNNYFLENQKS